MKSLVNVAFSALLAVGALAAPNGKQANGPRAAADQYKVKSLPQVNFAVPQSWAGSLPIGKGYGDSSLFFWLWEAEPNPKKKSWEGSNKEDLIIWFNGGPGCSSLTGLFKINGPITFPNTSKTPQRNPHAWTKAANVLYIDQPAGTGFNTGPTTDISNPVVNEAAVVQYLEAWFKIFPEMKKKRIHLMGESAAGVFLPYIAKLIQDKKETLNFNVSSLSLGNAQWGNHAVLQNVVASKFIRDHQSSVGVKVPADVLAVLNKAEKDCGFSNLLSKVTYPASGPLRVPGNPSNENFKRGNNNSGYNAALAKDFNKERCTFNNGGTRTAAQVAFLVNHSGPECFGTCGIFEAANTYFLDRDATYNVYNVNEKDYSTTYNDDAWVAYLNRADVQAAVHAPPKAKFTACNGAIQQTLQGFAARQAPPAYHVVPALLDQGVRVAIWAGTLDYLLPHNANEVIVQNMTWGGVRGLTHALKKPLLDKGVTHGTGYEERGLSYFRIEGAGHRVGQDKPEAALLWVLERVVRNNSPKLWFSLPGVTGLVRPVPGGGDRGWCRMKNPIFRSPSKQKRSIL